MFRLMHFHNRLQYQLSYFPFSNIFSAAHHWSPLSDEVVFVRTTRDIQQASFECAKDRHLIPWCDVNVRFGFVRYAGCGGKANGNCKVVGTMLE